MVLAAACSALRRSMGAPPWLEAGAAGEKSESIESNVLGVRGEPRPQLGLQHLAVVVLGQLVDDVALGTLEAGDVVEALASSSDASSVAPGLATTKATTSSPHSASAVPRPDLSNAGRRSSTSSTSRG